MNPVYTCFLRNWENCRAKEKEIDLAVSKGLITEKEADKIKVTKQNKTT